MGGREGGEEMDQERIGRTVRGIGARTTVERGTTADIQCPVRMSYQLAVADKVGSEHSEDIRYECCRRMKKNRRRCSVVHDILLEDCT